MFGHGVNDEFVSKIAQTPEEVSQLIDEGFEYVTDMDNNMSILSQKIFSEKKIEQLIKKIHQLDLTGSL